MSAAQPAIDIGLKYVRVTERRADGLVEFEFAIGEPGLFVEMLLPEAAYEAFCRSNAVIHLEAREEAPASDWDWRLHEATRQRFR